MCFKPFSGLPLHPRSSPKWWLWPRHAANLSPAYSGSLISHDLFGSLSSHISPLSSSQSTTVSGHCTCSSCGSLPISSPSYLSFWQLDCLSEFILKLTFLGVSLSDNFLHTTLHPPLLPSYSTLFYTFPALPVIYFLSLDICLFWTLHTDAIIP